MLLKISTENTSILSKKKKDIQTEKEVKLFLFTDDMILYVENSKESTPKKKKVIINEFSKVAGYKTHTQKSVMYSYTNTEQYEKKLRKQFHLH